MQNNYPNLTDDALYMNLETGSVGQFDDWDYENERGDTVNAVLLGEVVRVVQDDNGDWVQCDG